MESKFISEAVKIVKSAVEKDNAGALKEALALYKKSLRYFITGEKEVVVTFFVLAWIYRKVLEECVEEY